MGIVIPFPREAAPPLPSHWNRTDHGHFVHLTYAGTRSREEAIKTVECFRRLREDSPSVHRAAIQAAEEVKRRSP